MRYDRRGHGKSGVPKGPYTMERLGRDVLAVLDGLGIEKVNWCGLSMGGMVGQWLGANAPERIERLVLSNTSCLFRRQECLERPPQAGARKGHRGLRRAQHGALVHQGISRARAGGDRAACATMFAATPLEGYIGCGEAVRDMDHRELLPKIRRRRWSSPAGTIRRRRSRRTNISRTTFPAPSSTVLDAAHISNVEQPEAYTKAVLGFLTAR